MKLFSEIWLNDGTWNAAAIVADGSLLAHVADDVIVSNVQQAEAPSVIPMSSM